MAKKKQSGGGRLKTEGRSLVWVSPTKDQKEKIRLAAAFEGKPMSQFLLDHGLAAAEKNLEKIRNQA